MCDGAESLLAYTGSLCPKRSAPGPSLDSTLDSTLLDPTNLLDPTYLTLLT